MSDTNQGGTSRRPHLITAVPTPFRTDGSLDLDGTRALFADIASRPVDGAFVAGTTGEFTALERDERLAVLKAGLDAFGPDRAYQHVGAATAHQAVDLARAAVDLGSRKLAAVTPYYFPAPEAEVIDYFARLVKATPEAEVYAYLFEARTTTRCAPAILPRLFEVGVAGVKLSGYDDATVASYVEHAPDAMRVFSGNDVSFASLMAAGGDGVVSGVSSVFPAPFLQLRDAIAAGDEARATELAGIVRGLVAVVHAGEIRYLKAGVEARGLPGGPVRAAVAPLPDDDRAAIDQAVGRWAL
ncbi:MAG: dihydrodipicolinate synthase family protein [Propioniciclava sp.]|uniref:dihydrodipicolinate synthase family protein n=1 Tax=Propioniciclava sp. TaxID=2038686 RepID=UPI0039E4D4BE